MDLLITAPLLGVGLAMDCFAVSLAAGAKERANRLRTALLIAFFFGAFQSGMFIAGWWLGAGFSTFIAAYDHWVAFLLLLIVGIRMIYEGFYEEESESRIRVQSLALITILAVATSIDSLAVGFGLALLQVVPIVPALIIGLVSAGFSVAGVLLGGRLAMHLGRPVHFIGGAILILIGLRVVLSHTGVL